MRVIITLCIAVMACAFQAQAQQQKYDHPDVAPTTSYDPLDVWNEWKVWYANPTENTSYVQEFMTQYEVPQKGMKNLSREETWYWWISNNEDAIESYYKMKEDALD
ncbi:MAG TPA: hypothetical protein DCX14_08890 [Flavobacteriales bacterium]|jgi:hypothetical protein|nr:hypothetical protein [Flavobacteriales bacterium]MDB9701245.1 hypothetical protein [Salibacteraceae bacterium]HAW20284.1 hypothetical protein [Flavobacteriales bacterium]